MFDPFLCVLCSPNAISVVLCNVTYLPMWQLRVRDSAFWRMKVSLTLLFYSNTDQSSEGKETDKDDGIQKQITGARVKI